MINIWHYRWEPGFVATLWGVVPIGLIENIPAMHAAKICKSYKGPRSAKQVLEHTVIWFYEKEQENVPT